MSKRRQFSGSFKAKVALEAIREELSLSALAAKHKLHPTQISTWKKEALSRLEEVFSGKQAYAVRDHDQEIRDLHAKIGQLVVERDFLQDAFRKK